MTSHKVWIQKVTEENSKLLVGQPFPGMWYGTCDCGIRTQFWFWGATLGYMLQHQWQMSMGVDVRERKNDGKVRST